MTHIPRTAVEIGCRSNASSCAECVTASAQGVARHGKYMRRSSKAAPQKRALRGPVWVERTHHLWNQALTVGVLLGSDLSEFIGAASLRMTRPEPSFKPVEPRKATLDGP